jgi:hypothetical protein
MANARVTEPMPSTQRAPARIALASLVATLAATPVRAEVADARARILLDVAESTENCTSASELMAAVETELGREVFVRNDAPAKTTVGVRIQRGASGTGYRALVGVEPDEVETSAPAPASTRELVTDKDCRALDEQLALVVALLVDDELRRPVAPAPPSVSPDAEPDPPPPKEPVQSFEPVSSAPNWESAYGDAPWRFDGDVSAATGFGMVPHVGFGAELGFLAATAGIPALRLRVLGLASVPVEPTPDASVSFFYAAGGGALCPTLATWTKARLRSCIGADLAVIRAESRGLEDARVALRFLAEFGLGLRGTLALGSGWLGTLALGASIPTRLDRFVYQQDGGEKELFQVAPVQLVATLGATREFH